MAQGGPQGARNQKLCGAQTRRGGLCQGWAMGNGRCRMHGGVVGGQRIGNTHAVIHGIYSQVLGDKDQEELEELAKAAGSVDQELALVRWRLKKTVEAQEVWNQAEVARELPPEIERLMTVEEVKEVSESREVKEVIIEDTTTTTTKKRPDFDALISRWVTQIRHLEDERIRILETSELRAKVEAILQAQADQAAALTAPGLTPARLPAPQENPYAQHRAVPEADADEEPRDSQ